MGYTVGTLATHVFHHANRQCTKRNPLAPAPTLSSPR